MIIPFSLLSTHSLRDTLWWRSYYSRYADCNFCLNVIKMLSYERMQHGLKIHIYIFICAHTKKYSQLSKDKDTYYTSLTEWHSKGPFGYTGEETILFSILWWAPFSQIVKVHPCSYFTTSIIIDKWWQMIHFFFLFMYPFYVFQV